MLHIVALTHHRTVAAPIARAFAVIADIESYPRFVPGFVAARIIRQEAGRIHALNRLAVGPFAASFETVATPTPPTALHVAGALERQGRLEIDWRLTAMDARHTRVDFSLRVQLRSGAAALALRRLVGPMSGRILTAFTEQMQRAAG